MRLILWNSISTIYISNQHTRSPPLLALLGSLQSWPLRTKFSHNALSPCAAPLPLYGLTVKTSLPTWPHTVQMLQCYIIFWYSPLQCMWRDPLKIQHVSVLYEKLIWPFSQRKDSSFPANHYFDLLNCYAEMSLSFMHKCVVNDWPFLFLPHVPAFDGNLRFCFVFYSWFSPEGCLWSDPVVRLSTLSEKAIGVHFCPPIYTPIILSFVELKKNLLNM